MDGNTQSALDRALTAQRAAYRADPMPSLETRLDRLARIGRLVDENREAIIDAIGTDFGHRSPHETLLADVSMLGGSVRHAMRHTAKWMKPRRVPTPKHYLPGSNRLLRQPLGVVGIVAPWNYPCQLSLGPAIGAIAAGNRVMIKPSELTPTFSALLERLVARSFSAEEMLVVPGGVELARAFVSLPFDHLLYTGSTSVGRQVAVAAAKNLTPVTLELGGKCPAILDRTCDLAVAAPRIVFTKLFNAGQTCLAPDYLLVPRGSSEEVANRLAEAVRRLYPSIEASPDYSSVIDDRHFSRLAMLIDDAQRKGASVRPLATAPMNGRKLAPTLVLGATRDMALMREEIFGPVLPILEYDGVDEAIEFVNDGDRPLALYWFGSDDRARDRVLERTVSGGVTINDCIWHFGQETQPFGGVGASGMGTYRGEWGFRTFSQEKPVFEQARFDALRFLYPPYGKMFEGMIALLDRIT